MRWDPRCCHRLLVLVALVLVSVSAGSATLGAAAALDGAGSAGAPIGAVPPAQTVSLRYGSPGGHHGCGAVYRAGARLLRPAGH